MTGAKLLFSSLGVGEMRKDSSECIRGVSPCKLGEMVKFYLHMYESRYVGDGGCQWVDTTQQ